VAVGGDGGAGGVIFTDEAFVTVEVVDGTGRVAGGVIGGLLDASAQGVVAVASLEVVLGVFGLIEPAGAIVGEAFVPVGGALGDGGQAAVFVVVVLFCACF